MRTLIMIYAPVKTISLKTITVGFDDFVSFTSFDAKRPNFGIYYMHAHIPGDSHTVTDTTADTKRAIFRLINPS